MASVNNFTDVDCYLPVTIASGATASDTLDIVGLSVCGFVLPATFTGTAVTFQTAISPTATFQTLYDTTNTAIGATVTQGRNYSVNPANFAAWRYVKIVSGSAEGGARTIYLACRQI